MKNRTRRSRQQDFFYGSSKNRGSEFGGVDLTSNPKTSHPVSTKNHMHITLKTLLPCSQVNFLRHERVILGRFQELAKKIGLVIREVVVMTNHCHFVVKLEHRKALKSFLRAVGSYLRSLFQLQKNITLFPGRPFTRFVNWGKDLAGVLCYLVLNKLEKKGIKKEKGREILRKREQKDKGIFVFRQRFGV